MLVNVSAKTRPRQSKKVMLAMTDSSTIPVECYNFNEDRWIHLSNYCPGFVQQAVGIQGLVYGFGNFAVHVYDSSKNVWSSAPNMKASRSGSGVAVLNNCIYVIGGQNLNSAEVLDLSVPSLNLHPVNLNEDGSRRPQREWRSISNMSTKRHIVGVGVLGDFIYAVGGYDGKSSLASVEVYAPKEDSWKRVADMRVKRRGLGVGVLNGVLYSVGGYNSHGGTRKDVECYNPDRDEWTFIREMNFARTNASVVTNNGLLYVIGGHNGSSFLQSIEVYDPKTNIWTVLPSDAPIRKRPCVCVIDNPLLENT